VCLGTQGGTAEEEKPTKTRLSQAPGTNCALQQGELKSAPSAHGMQEPVQTRNPNHPYPSFPQNTPAPQKAYTPSNRPSQGPMNPRRCFKYQGLGHIAADCPNRRVITLAEWDAMKEEVAEEEKEESVEATEEKKEEVIAEADEGEMLVLST